MLKKTLVAALAASMTLVLAAQAPAQTKKKKVAQATTQEEKDAQNEVMEDLVFGVATGVLGGALKKSKMPKGGKQVFKHGLKAVKNAKKVEKKEGGKKKKASLSALFAGGEEE